MVIMNVLKPLTIVFALLCLAGSALGKLNDPSASAATTTNSSALMNGNLQVFDDDVEDDIFDVVEGGLNLEQCEGDVS